MPDTEVIRRRLVMAHRLVQLGILLNLLWKWSFFEAAYHLYRLIPVDDPFFPDWLRSLEVLVTALIGTVAATAVSLVTSHQIVRRFCAWLATFGCALLCVHQATYNDMTFVTAWWASLWSLWFVHRDWNHRPEALLARGALLGRMMLAVILLGGAAGKWTGEYWSGEVLYDIYFRDRDFWLFNLLRSNFDADQMRMIAQWYSRIVVVFETASGLCIWLLPPRAAAVIGILVSASIAVLSNFYLFSVVSSMIGLAAVGLLVPRRGDAGDRTTSPPS